MEIGERIRQLRLHKRMTQGELIDGISSISYLSRVENGNAKPSQAFIKSIAPRLGVKPEDLLDRQITNAEQRVSTIYLQFQKEKYLNDEDLSFIRLNSTEMYSTHVYLQIYVMMIYYYCRIDIDLEEAYHMYKLSLKFIPDQVEPTLSEEFFHYYRVCGVLFFNKQDYIKANHYHVLGEELLDYVEDRLEVANFYHNMSMVKQEIVKDQTISLFYAQKSYDLFLEENNYPELAAVLITMGIQYHLNHQLDKSIECLSKAKEMVDPDNIHFLGIIEFHLGRVYVAKKEFEVAINYYLNSLRFYEKIDNNKRIYAYKRLVEAYMELKDWEKVEYYLNKALSLVDPELFPFLYIDLISIRANTYRLRLDESRYEKEMQRIINLGIENNQLILVTKLANQLAHYYFERRAYKKSANFFVLASKYENELSSLNN